MHTQPPGRKPRCENYSLIYSRFQKTGSFLSLAGASLSRQGRVCRDKTRLVSRQKYTCFVATKIFCRDKHTFVAAKDVFVATKMILVAAPANNTFLAMVFSSERTMISAFAVS